MVNKHWYWHQIPETDDIKTIPQPQGDIRHEHKTNSGSTVLASDTRDVISKQYPSCKEISGAKHKTNSGSTVSASDTRDIISKQYPSCKEIIRCKNKTNSSERQYIMKVRETVFTSHCTFLLEKVFHFLTQLFFIFEFESTRMGESLINLVCQYPALWDKQNSKYKDSNYKNVKWRGNWWNLGVPKDDAIKKWKSLQDTCVRHKKYQSKKWWWLEWFQTQMEVLYNNVIPGCYSTERRYAAILLIYIHAFIHNISVM